MLLSKMAPGSYGEITNINDSHPTQPKAFPELGARLIEIGFEEGARINVLHESPISKDPMAIKINGRIIALRRVEAEGVDVNISLPESSE